MRKQIIRFLRKGSGTALMGCAVMVLLFSMVLGMIMLLNFRLAAGNVQVSADTLADGVAAYMAAERGTYEEACERMETLAAYLQQYTGVDIVSVSLDEDALEGNEAQITLTARCTTGSLDGGSLTYTVTRRAVTEFTQMTILQSRFGITSDIPYVNFAVGIAEDNTHGYSQSSRYGNPDYDCSSLVAASLRAAGYSVGDFSTDSEPGALRSAGFTEYPFSLDILMPGDILHRYGHTAIYCGGGMCVEAYWDENHDGGQNVVSEPGDQLAGREAYEEIGVHPVSANYTSIFRLVS